MKYINFNTIEKNFKIKKKNKIKCKCGGYKNFLIPTTRPVLFNVFNEIGLRNKTYLRIETNKHDGVGMGLACPTHPVTNPKFSCLLFVYYFSLKSC